MDDLSTVTIEQAAHELDKAVQSRGGGYIYERNEDGTCDYVRNGEPSCLVGTVLHAMGIPLEVLSAHESKSASYLVRELGGDPEVGYYLTSVQVEQDNGVSWEAAVLYANMTHNV